MSIPLKLLIFAVLLCASSLVLSGWEDARVEREAAMSLIPNIERGEAIYTICAVCHMPEGWGTPNGAYPQIAGQHKNVIIKQLADIQKLNRDNPSMLAFSIPDEIGGPQAIADVSEYIGSLKMTRETGKGDGTNVSYGEKLYLDKCSDCHGVNGEGDPDKAYPLLLSQHYNYLLRQMIWIQNGKRRNANSEMIDTIKEMNMNDFKAIADYLSRIDPPPEMLSPYSWKNRK